MEVSVQKRKPGRCREWERIRRNKFNDTITKLGEVAKAINKTIFPDEEVDDTQCPKVEIIQKAIICLTNCSQQITHLKAEILAIQVQLDTEKSKKAIVKDASTQVYCGLTRKRKDGKYVKLLMVKKANVKKNNKEKTKVQVEPKKLPVLLPRTTNKKGPENTIVVLPAPPYIFPPRPLLFPTMPPAIVVIDQNLQPVNKTSVPLVNRNNGDITKTTMVNILPISAYSHPLSAVKSKKSNVKLKTDVKKVNKKKKTMTSKELSSNNVVKNITTIGTTVTTAVTSVTNNIESSNKENIATTKDVSKLDGKDENDKINVKQTPQLVTNDNLQKDINVNKDDKSNSNLLDKNIDNNSKVKENEVPKTLDESTQSVNREPSIQTSTLKTTINTNVNIKNTDENKSDKKTIQVNKDKDNKLPNILPLDTPLCDNAVDTGNARLELAEEFLATSPTAAFLMSFPLVSGNRADSPPEDHSHTTQNNPKENQRRPENVPSAPFFEKPINNDVKIQKSVSKFPATVETKQTEQQKDISNSITKDTAVNKLSNPVTLPSITNENPFLNLSMPSMISTTCTLSDTTFGMDFDCNVNKSMSIQPTSYSNSNNFFYKSDPFGTVKNTIYSTSNITSGHEFNSLGLYPCAMEKYSSKNKSDYSSVDDSLMKMGSSRLTYDIDLGWSHKGLDFVNCTTSANTFNKDSLLTTTSASYTSSYNPFNPDFHVPLVSSSSKKDNSNKVPSSFVDTMTNLYSHPTNLWTEDVPFYTNSNVAKVVTTKSQNYQVSDQIQGNTNIKMNNNQHYETKMTETNVGTAIKPNNNVGQQIPEKYTKKSPSKMHINWMTSEVRSAQNNFNVLPHSNMKETHKSSYNHHLDHSVKKQDHNEGNYFPISIHNYPPQTAQEEFQVWPSSTRPLGTTEISIDPPPINLPTLVGDLALGPHDKNKKEVMNRTTLQADIQNCGNFLSVTQLMNRSTDNMHSRFQVPNMDTTKPVSTKQHLNQFSNDNHRKGVPHLENHVSQPCYVFNGPKTANSYDNMPHFTQTKTKSNNKTEKSSKTNKNNYSTEALLRGANCTQKLQDTNSSNKFMMSTQKYNEYSTSQDTAVAQVSHFPAILDYSDNGYAGQQYSGTTLYNTTTNTISNSFYSNFMPGTSNLMSSNYTGGPFTGEYIDYNQTAECNYANHKYEELKMRNNSNIFQTEKVATNYKSSRRESTLKHKLECSKKDSNKKYQSKKAKISNEIEDWNDPSHVLWQNKGNKKHANLVTDELPFPNYMGNQIPTQYQSDYFNSHLMPSNMQTMGHNVDRSLSSFPVTSRANFNLSTIFPEITMKVQ